MDLVSGLGSLTIAAWSACVGVAIGLILSEVLHSHDDPAESAVHSGSDDDDGRDHVAGGDVDVPSQYYTLQDASKAQEGRWKAL